VTHQPSVYSPKTKTVKTARYQLAKTWSVVKMTNSSQHFAPCDLGCEETERKPLDGQQLKMGDSRQSVGSEGVGQPG
jgi:hypothetical protein